MATRRTIQAALTEFGLTLETEDLYWRVHGRHGQTVTEAAAYLGYTPDDLAAALQPLLEMGAVEVDADGLLSVPPMAHVLSRLLDHEVQQMEAATRRVRELATAVPHVVPRVPVVPGSSEPLSGHRGDGADLPLLMARWIEESTGDLVTLRPDQWRHPTHPALRRALVGAMEAGRQAKALYPARALEEAPDALLERARMGEDIRVLAHVPTRLFVIPATHALVPDMPGYETARVLAVHERALVLLLAQYVEQLWERAVPVPELDLRGARERSRRLLLGQLASGAADEQIARTLGVSLRTVRRRVADLMIDLGADSRFQAGVEAARRGWI
ncbi:MAG TPA: DNA-binding response regulator [Nocardioides sp.]